MNVPQKGHEQARRLTATNPAAKQTLMRVGVDKLKLFY
jgi:hypothetical protein